MAPVCRKPIPVTQAVYKAYYQEYEHERYLNKKSVEHEHSFEQLVESGVSIDFYCVGSQSPVEDTLLAAEQVRQLRECLSHLSSEEQAILVEIFFFDLSAKELAGRLWRFCISCGLPKAEGIAKVKDLCSKFLAT